MIAHQRSYSSRHLAPWIIIIVIVIIIIIVVEQIVSQSHQLPEDSLTKLAQQEVRSERSKELEHRAEPIKEMAPRKTQAWFRRRTFHVPNLTE